MSAQRKTVTLFIYLPESKKVILARRGKLERHADVLQATVHGQIEPGEIPQLAMKREMKEEVKGSFDKLSQIREYGEAEVGNTVKEKTYYFAAMLPEVYLETLKPTQEVAELVLAEETDVKKMIPYSKARGTEGYDYAANMVMFDDEIEVLKKVFADYKKVK